MAKNLLQNFIHAYDVIAGSLDESEYSEIHFASYAVIALDEKPFVRSELLNRIRFHSSNIDYEKFYAEHVPKSHLPSDFGGDLESVEVLHKKQGESLMELRDYFLAEEEQLNLSYDKFADEYSKYAYFK